MSRTYLLIGGRSGIGASTTRLLTCQGDSVITTSRNPDPTGDVRHFNAEAPAPFDLPDQLDGLVYFPGSIQLQPFSRLTADDFLKEFEVNCLGAVAAIQSALPALKSAPAASIVLFSTVAVAQGLPFHASIAAAKGAVEGLTLSLAAELAPKIRVNAIAPSLTDTPLGAPLLNTDAKREASAKRHPLKQIGAPDDVAALVAFLLSDASKFMTGQILRPDGGLSSVRTF